MRLFRLRVTMLAMAASIAGCGSDSLPPPVEPMPPPPPAAVDFSSFVIDQFGATADDTGPQAVDETDFEFNDQENPGAFSDLLSET